MSLITIIQNNTPIITSFNIKKLIDIQIIKPNENQGEKDLSKIFSQIIKYNIDKKEIQIEVFFKLKLNYLTMICPERYWEWIY